MTRRSRGWPQATAMIVAAAAVSALAAAFFAPGEGKAVAQAAPANTAAPAVSGEATAGQRLTVSNGSWTGSPASFAYQWLRCDAALSSCAAIDGATAASYDVAAAADVDRRLRARVTATNPDGSTAAQSNATETVKAAPATGQPANTKDPAISGTARIGETLRVTAGDWSGAQPITFAFQWLRCDQAGNNCVNVGGATDDAYQVRDLDRDRTMRVRVTARNSAGSTSELTPATAVVQSPEGPAGAIKLSTGETSIPVTSVPANESLVVEQAVFEPSVIRSQTAPFQVRIKVKDTRGFVVRDALVFIRSTPLVTQRSVDRDTPTAQDGWVSVTMTPERDFPVLDPNYALQFYVKAYRSGDPILGGVAGTRLIQVPLGR